MLHKWLLARGWKEDPEHKGFYILPKNVLHNIPQALYVKDAEDLQMLLDALKEFDEGT